MCICAPRAGGGQKGHQMPLELELVGIQTYSGWLTLLWVLGIEHWSCILGYLEEQSVHLTSETSLQPHKVL